MSPTPGTAPATLVEALERAATSEQGVQFVDGTETALFLSYNAILSRARRAATALRELGIGAGDRMAIVLRTSPEFYDAFFGALIAGAIPVPLYPPVRLGGLGEYHDRTRGLLVTARCRAVVTEPLLAGLVRPALDSIDGIALTVLDQLPERELPIADLAPDAPAFVQFSSGTTGSPKGVRLTHRQVLANIAAIHAMILRDVPEVDGLRHVAGSWLPLYHDMGLVGCLLASVVHGATLVLIPPEIFLADPAVWLRAVSTYRVTVSPAPNFAFGYCASQIRDEDLAGVDLTSWRLALNGAEPVTPEAIQRFAERFTPFGFDVKAIVPVYGLAEATLLVCAAEIGRPVRFERFVPSLLASEGRAIHDPRGVCLASVGRPVPGCAIEIRDADCQPVGEGTIGRVHVSSPSLMDGYEGEDASPRTAWLDTGDLGFLLGEELFLYGRSQDLLIVRGQKHAPEPIERAAEEVAGVRTGRTAAFSVPDPASGTEAVVVVVERRRDKQRQAADLACAVQRSVVNATGLRPWEVRVCDPGTLPRTSNGKIRRGAARDWYLEGR